MNFQTTKCLNADVPLMDFKGGKKKKKTDLKIYKADTLRTSCPQQLSQT